MGDNGGDDWEDDDSDPFAAMGGCIDESSAVGGYSTCCPEAAERPELAETISALCDDSELGAVLRIGVLAIAANAYPGLEEVAMVGFKESEIEALAAEADAVFGAAALDAPDLLEGLGAKSLREMHAAALGVLKTRAGAPAYE